MNQMMLPSCSDPIHMYNGQVCRRKASAVSGLSSISLRALIPYVYCSTHQDLYPAVICAEPAGVFRIWHSNGQRGYFCFQGSLKLFQNSFKQLGNFARRCCALLNYSHRTTKQHHKYLYNLTYKETMAFVF